MYRALVAPVGIAPACWSQFDPGYAIFCQIFQRTDKDLLESSLKCPQVCALPEGLTLEAVFSEHACDTGSRSWTSGVFWRTRGCAVIPSLEKCCLRFGCKHCSDISRLPPRCPGCIGNAPSFSQRPQRSLHAAPWEPAAGRDWGCPC